MGTGCATQRLSVGTKPATLSPHALSVRSIIKARADSLGILGLFEFSVLDLGGDMIRRRLALFVALFVREERGQPSKDCAEEAAHYRTSL